MRPEGPRVLHSRSTSLEEWWGRHADDYYAAFDCFGDAFDPKTDVTPLVRAHVTAQRDQVRSLDLRERTQRTLWTLIENLLSELRLPGRLANAVWEAAGDAETTRALVLSTSPGARGERWSVMT